MDLTPDVTTPLLRRCTALATMARVELLSEHSHRAADELSEVLEEIVSWSGSRLDDPDPTMLALCAAALLDLADRIPGAATALAARVADALGVLTGQIPTGPLSVRA